MEGRKGRGSIALREVDVLVAPALDAAGLFERSVTLDLDGTPIRVAAIDDLIAMKRGTGRPHDLDDVLHLERLRKGRDR